MIILGVDSNMVIKFLKLFFSPRMFEDWQIAMPHGKDRKKTTWNEFAAAMQSYYRCTGNLTELPVPLIKSSD